MSHVSSVPVDLNQHGVPDILRPVANYRPSIWEDIFLQYDSESLVGWVPPPPSVFKVNVDGSYRSSSNSAACGGLVRNSDGIVISAFHCNLGRCNALWAELWGLKYGIQVANQLNLPHVIFEMDSLTVVNMIQQAYNQSPLISSFIRDINRSLSLSHWQTSLVHVYREGNRGADFMANWGHQGGYSLICNNDIPAALVHIVAEDTRSVLFLQEVDNNVKHQAQILKEEVKKMFQLSINQNIIELLNFIDLVQRFCVSYHFQREINQALEQIYNTLTKNNTMSEEGDHHSCALLFRMLRQQGYQISSNAFNKLKNEQGNFNETIAKDIQGLCSLYEAAHLRTHKDDILEEAYGFSNAQLESLAKQLSSSVAAQINHCLRQPLNKSVPRYEARYHMTIYEQDPSHNEILLTFAKIDFNILQKLHQKEIGNIIKWCRRSNIGIKVPHARVRLVEGYFWSLAMSYQPEYSKGRMLIGKMIVVLTLLDDTYDAYGTIQELELFTKAIQRWDVSFIRSLPQCMKAVFDIIVELCEEIELVTTKSGNSSFVVPYFKQALFKAVEGYMVEAKWLHDGYIPTYEEYKVNGILTTCVPALLTSFIVPGEFGTKDVFEWIFNDPTIIEVASVIGRLLDDLGSNKFEQQRVHVASSVECCMKQYDISHEEAYNLIHNDVEDCWKIINEECLKSNDIPKFVVDFVVNCARSFEFIYGDHQDKYTNGELLKDYISQLLIMDPICIDQHE